MSLLTVKKVLLSARMVEDAEVPPTERQVPAIAKQPVLRFIPLANVDVPEVMFSRVAESPPANVLVPCPAPTVMAAPNVLVAVVEVATKFCATTWPATESMEYGEEVPMPTTPPDFTMNSVLFPFVARM